MSYYDNAGQQAQVASSGHIQEEVSTMRSFFEKLATAFVQASEFAEQLKQLQGQFDSLRNDADVYRNRIETLDRELGYVREARDKATGELYTANTKLNEQAVSIHNLEHDVKSKDETVTRLQSDLNSARTDRDEVHYKNLELEEALTKANAKLAKFHALVAEDMPTHSAVEPQSYQPVPVTEAQPVEEPSTKRVYPGEPGFNWNEAQKYDPDRSQYYMEVAA